MGNGKVFCSQQRRGSEALYHLPSTIYHLRCMLPPAKKIGLLAVLFFTVKGLLWLIVPFVIYKWGC